MTVKTEDIKKLRAGTGAPVMDCKRALEESSGDTTLAKQYLAKLGVDRAQKKKGREASRGLVYSYIHLGGKVGAMVEVNCETDFVAKTEDFQGLVHEIGMQIASMDPKDVNELLEQSYIRDPKKTMKLLIDETIGVLGENIKVARFTRYAVGV